MHEDITPEQLRQARQKYGLTQADLAEMMCVSSHTVARWERGSVPVHQGLARLALEVLRLRREKEQGSK